MDDEQKLFIIPLFNPTYNLDKLKNIPISSKCSFIRRYIHQHLCLLFLHTKQKMIAKDVRELFGAVPTVLNSKYIPISQPKKIQTSTLYFYNIPKSIANLEGLSELMNTFGKAKIQIFLESSYVKCSYHSLEEAIHAYAFISHIPFAEGKIIVSTDPFDLPFVSFSFFSPTNDLQILLQFLTEKYKPFVVSFYSDENNQIIIQFENNEDAQKAIKEFHYAQLNNHFINTQYYLDQTTKQYYETCYQIRVPLSAINLEKYGESNLEYAFYYEMNTISPVFETKLYYDQKYGLVIFRNINELPRVLSENVKFIFANCLSYHVFNFPPNTSVKKIRNWIDQTDLKILNIERCYQNDKQLLPCFIIRTSPQTKNFIEEIETRKFVQSYLVALNSYSDDDKLSILQKYSSENTIEIESPEINFENVYYFMTRMFPIKMFRFNKIDRKYYITYIDYQSAKSTYQTVKNDKETLNQIKATNLTITRQFIPNTQGLPLSISLPVKSNLKIVTPSGEVINQKSNKNLEKSETENPNKSIFEFLPPSQSINSSSNHEQNFSGNQKFEFVPPKTSQNSTPKPATTYPAFIPPQQNSFPKTNKLSFLPPTSSETESQTEVNTEINNKLNSETKANRSIELPKNAANSQSSKLYFEPPKRKSEPQEQTLPLFIPPDFTPEINTESQKIQIESKKDIQINLEEKENKNNLPLFFPPSTIKTSSTKNKPQLNDVAPFNPILDLPTTNSTSPFFQHDEKTKQKTKKSAFEKPQKESAFNPPQSKTVFNPPQSKTVFNPPQSKTVFNPPQ